MEQALQGTDTARIHWATFDAAESNPEYNANNCEMAADLLNENIKRLNEGRSPSHFWCEKGRYRS